MDSCPREDERQVRRTICDFAERELNPGAAERDRTSAFPRELWQRCAGIGILAMPFPEAWGGYGYDFLTTVAAFHALGRACTDSGLVHALACQVICGIQILLFGSDEQREQLLPDLVAGKVIYCQGITEPGSGSDAFAMHTTAIRTSGGYVLNGAKTMISNGPVADRASVFAVTDPVKKSLGGVSCFIVAKGNPGFCVGKPMQKMGLRTLMNGELVFGDCEVSASAMLGREGQGAILFGEAMEWERILLPACLLGQLERVLTVCVQYAQQRKTFGQSIGEYQAVSHKIAEMKMNAELGRLALYNAAALKDQHKRAALESSVTKLFISESLKQACLDAVQIHGGYGYMSEYGVERELRDAIASTIYSGTSEMQANIIARLAGLRGCGKN